MSLNVRFWNTLLIVHQENARDEPECPKVNIGIDDGMVSSDKPPEAMLMTNPDA